MPKKNMTEEERKAFGEKMKLAREAKKEVSTQPTQELKEESITVTKSELTDLLKTVAELKSQLAQPNQFRPLEQAQIGSRGIQGVQEKYSTEKGRYTDPSERLSQEPRLRQFAFPVNYELNFKQFESRYQDVNGVWNKEPRFEIELWQIMFDEDGNDSMRRALQRRLIMHEDTDAAVEIAEQEGITIESEDKTAFLDEMRYLRAKAWLMDIFYPAKPQVTRGQKMENIGGRVIPVFEVTSTKAEGIKVEGKPFSV